jgi:hypothetical protein
MFRPIVGYWLLLKFAFTRFVIYNQHRLVLSSVLYSTTYISATLQ